MIKIANFRKFFMSVLACTVVCLSFVSSALAQIRLEDQSDGESEKVKMIFDNQMDVDNLIIGISGVIGDINGMKLQNRNIGKVMSYDEWIAQFAALFMNNIFEFMMDNPLKTKATLCKIFAQNISVKKLEIKVFGDYRFVKVDYDAIVEGLNKFIIDYLREETVKRYGLPYSIVFCP